MLTRRRLYNQISKVKIDKIRAHEKYQKCLIFLNSKNKAGERLVHYLEFYVTIGFVFHLLFNFIFKRRNTFLWTYND